MICAPMILFAAVTLSKRGGVADGSFRHQCAAPLYPVALLWVALALFVAFVMPRSLDHALAHEAPETKAPETPEKALPVEARRCLVQLGWAIALERACMVAGIELGTSMLLETHFGWPLHA